MKKGLIRRSNHYYKFRPHEKWEKFDLMNSISWKKQFRSHEIQPPDPEPNNTAAISKNLINFAMNILKQKNSSNVTDIKSSVSLT